VAEKLLANADRGLDPATGHRDAVDLGFLAHATRPRKRMGRTWRGSSDRSLPCWAARRRQRMFARRLPCHPTPCVTR
jgi:hypothetical protein